MKRENNYQTNIWVRYSMIQSHNLVFYGFVLFSREESDKPQSLKELAAVFSKRFNLEYDMEQKLIDNYTNTQKVVFELVKSGIKV